MKFKKSYVFHNVVGHPLAELVSLPIRYLFGEKLGVRVWSYIHDRTLPKMSNEEMKQ
jgi:hypothetical protein